MEPAPGSSRRPMLAGTLSLVLHGAALLVLVLVGVHTRTPRRPVDVALAPVDMAPRPTAVDVATLPAPAAHGIQGTSETATKQALSSTKASAGTLGRRGHTAPPPSRTQGAARVARLADVAMSYESPRGTVATNPRGDDGPGVGAALAGDGVGAEAGVGGAGASGLEVPEAPPSSARAPHPKGEYARWSVAGAQEFANRKIEVELHIDAAGAVKTVKLLAGVSPWLDAHAIKIAYEFEFFPALNDAGEPVECDYRWTFWIQRDQT